MPHARVLLRSPVLALAVVPVLFAPETDPWHAVALAAAAAGCALALLAPGVRPPGRRGFVLFGLALVPLLLSAWSPLDAGGARDRLVLFAVCLVAFRAGRDLLGESGREALTATLTALGSVTALYGIQQRLFGFDLALEMLRGAEFPEASVIAGRIASGRVFSTFLLPSTFAGFLLLSLPATVAWGRAPAAGRGRRAAAVAAGSLQAVALFLTYSHGAWVALAAALVWTMVTSGSRHARRTALAAAALAVVALLAVTGLRGERLGRGDDPASERLGNWTVALRQIGDHPVRGVGWGSYGAAYTRYQGPGMNQSRFAHNTYLQTAAEGGLVTLPFLALFVVAALRRRAGTRADAGLGIGIAAVLMHNVVDFTLLLPAVGVPFFVLLGSLLAGSPPARPARWAGRASAVGLAAGILLLGVPAAAARGLAVAAREDVLAGRAAEAGRRIGSAIRLDPWTAEYRDFAARWELESGDGTVASLARARDLARGACERAPTVPHHRTTLEMVCLAQGDLACAYRAASRAAALFPLSPEYAARRAALRDLVEGR